MKMQRKRTWKWNRKEHENATLKNMKMQHKRTWKCNKKEHENAT